MAEIVPRWEWRTFARSAQSADAVFETMEPVVEECEELYLLTPGGDNVEVRDGLMDVKVLRETDDYGLQAGVDSSAALLQKENSMRLTGLGYGRVRLNGGRIRATRSMQRQPL